MNDALDPLKLAGAKAKGKRPYFFEDPDVERVLSITMAVAGELAVVRQRLDTIERLLDEKGVVTREDVETYVPDSEAAVERGRWTEEYLARVLRIVQQETEAIERPDEPTSGEVAEELSKS